MSRRTCLAANNNSSHQIADLKLQCEGLLGKLELNIDALDVKIFGGILIFKRTISGIYSSVMWQISLNGDL